MTERSRKRKYSVGGDDDIFNIHNFTINIRNITKTIPTSVGEVQYAIETEFNEKINKKTIGRMPKIVLQKGHSLFILMENFSLDIIYIILEYCTYEITGALRIRPKLVYWENGPYNFNLTVGEISIRFHSRGLCDCAYILDTEKEIPYIIAYIKNNKGKYKIETVNCIGENAWIMMDKYMNNVNENEICYKIRKIEKSEIEMRYQEFNEVHKEYINEMVFFEMIGFDNFIYCIREIPEIEILIKVGKEVINKIIELPIYNTNRYIQDDNMVWYDQTSYY